MAKKYPKRYREYRGRRRRGSVVLKIIIALLVLVLLACLVFMVFLGGRVEYTDDGVRLVLPWMEDEPDVTDGPGDGPTSAPPVIIIDEPEEPSPQPSPEPSPVLEPIGAVGVPVSRLLDGTAAQAVAEGGGNALVVEMKTASGTVYWDSGTAHGDQVHADGAAVADAVGALAEQGEIYLVARVTCFRDQVLAARGVGGPLMTKGGNLWYDAQGLRWVSPASEEARTYLTRLCLELAELGFDEILLDCAGYPYFGETHVLATDDLRPEDLSAPVEVFWRELKAALAEREVRMSVLATPEMMLGTEAYSGIGPGLLDRYADRVWTEAPEGVDYSRSPVADRLVILGGSGEDESWSGIDMAY